jgi:predicted metal-binding membrane protein
VLTAGSATLRRDRAIGIGAIGAVVALAWVYLFMLAAADDMGSALAMPMDAAWTLRDWMFMTSMWAVMMIGMMLPSASPMVLAYRRFAAGRGSTPSFVLGYVVVWSAFAVMAAALQWLLHNAALVTSMGASSSPALAGTLLIAAGVFQFTSLKQACLGKCHTPLGFLMTQWRAGSPGAFVMGVRHGGYCVSCCWLLMTLLFVLGVMNLVWVAILAAIVLVEKVAPAAANATRLAGGGLVAWGAWIVAAAL